MKWIFSLMLSLFVLQANAQKAPKLPRLLNYEPRINDSVLKGVIKDKFMLMRKGNPWYFIEVKGNYIHIPKDSTFTRMVKGKKVTLIGISQLTWKPDNNIKVAIK